MLPNGADMSCLCQALNEVQIHEQTDLCYGCKPGGFRDSFCCSTRMNRTIVNLNCENTSPG